MTKFCAAVGLALLVSACGSESTPIAPTDALPKPTHVAEANLFRDGLDLIQDTQTDGSLQFTTGFINTGPGCASAVRGVLSVTFRGVTTALPWNFQPERLVAVNERASYSACCYRSPADATESENGTYGTFFAFTSVPCATPAL